MFGPVLLFMSVIFVEIILIYDFNKKKHIARSRTPKIGIVITTMYSLDL